MRPTAPGRPRLSRPTSTSPSPHPRAPRRRGPAVLVLALATLVALTSALPAYAAPGKGRTKAAPTTITSWTTPASMTAGAPVRTTVAVASPGADGNRAVVLQRRVGAGWATVVAARTDTRGAAVLSWRAPATAGTVTLRVTVAKAGRKRAAVSAARVVSVVAVPSTPTTPTTPPSPPTDPVLARTLELVNQARAQARSCGATTYAATPPLRSESRLELAADGWARRMATENFFAHEYGGSSPSQRIDATGYRWGAWGENIAAGQPTPDAVVAAWLKSPGHCTAIMSPSFTEVGIGFEASQKATYRTYWVLDFGRPR